LNNLSEQFNLLQKAKRLEKIGNSSEALRVYLELHKDHTPNTFDAYERPIILLEKFKRYEEAINMCEKAIGLVNDGKISGTVERFEHRLERINEKVSTLDHSSSKKKKPEKSKKEKKKKIKAEKKAPKDKSIKKDDTSRLFRRKKSKVKELSEDLNPTITNQEPIHNNQPRTTTDSQSNKTDSQSITKQDTIEADTLIKGSPFKYDNMFKKSGRKFSPLPPGFRSRRKSNMIIATLIYGLGFFLAFPDNYFLFITISVAFMSLNYFIDLLGYKTNNRHIGYTLITFVLTLVVLSYTGGSIINDQYNIDPNGSVTNGEGDVSDSVGPIIKAPLNDLELPLITDNHIQIAIDDITKETFVKDANIIVEDKTVSFGILVEPGTSTEEAKALGKSLTRKLASVVASNYSDISSPSEISYGELFDEYNAMVTVGSSSDDIIARGEKSKRALGFSWKLNN